jgi:hypothetical protein
VASAIQVCLSRIIHDAISPPVHQLHNGQGFRKAHVSLDFDLKRPAESVKSAAGE